MKNCHRVQFHEIKSNFALLKMAYNTAILTVFIAIFTVGFRAEQQCGDAEGEYYSFKINSNHLAKSKSFSDYTNS